MCEDYFHYYEDIDWSTRAKINFRLGYAPESVVYHKEGGSSGGGSNPDKKAWYQITTLLETAFSLRGNILLILCRQYISACWSQCSGE